MAADALVIPSLSYFSALHTDAYNLLSYQAIVKENSLAQQFRDCRGGGMALFFPKQNILHYDTPYKVNPYAKYLEPIAKRYFGEISGNDQKLMSNCYVFARSERETQEGLRSWLNDTLTPYFQADGGEDIDQVRSGGPLSQRIARALKPGGRSEVLILYGGKGAGKSTFLRRLFYFDTPQDLSLHGFPILIDCLSSPQNESELASYIWDSIIRALDVDGLLSGDLPKLLKLFSERYELAKRQTLYGVHEQTMDFIRERNRLLDDWKRDKQYVAKCLKKYWAANGKHTLIAFDNTDQLTPHLQDYCFLLSQNICRELEAVGIISMREERYCRARTAGVLDAYQNAGYHLSAPDLLGVFQKRIQLVIQDLEGAASSGYHDCLPDAAPFGALRAFFICCNKQFGAKGNALKEFLVECSRDNTRFALEFFRQFLSSGYTHVQEMIDEQNWNVSSHQVIKPMMVPQRFNYDEDKSIIPNVYKCRRPAAGSHFSMLRILRQLATSSGQGQVYSNVSSLVDLFESRFHMKEDCEECLDVLLSNGMIEASNRLDRYKIPRSGSEREYIYADQVRVTAFGLYMLDYLSSAFTYLELVSLDCGYFSEEVFQSMCQAAIGERNVGTPETRLQRLQSRLGRAERFVAYLEQQETFERAEFNIREDELFCPSIRKAFTREHPFIIASGMRNIKTGKRTEEDQPNPT